MEAGKTEALEQIDEPETEALNLSEFTNDPETVQLLESIKGLELLIEQLDLSAPQKPELNQKPAVEPSAFLRWPSPEEVPAVIDEATRLLVDELNPIQVILFGSQAREDAHEASDIDLMVVVTDEIEGTCLELANRGGSRLRNMPMPIDLLVQRYSLIQRGRDIPGSLERTIYTQGKILYERQ